MRMAAGSILQTVPPLSASALPACVRRAARRCLHRSERTVLAALVQCRQSQQGSQLVRPTPALLWILHQG